MTTKQVFNTSAELNYPTVLPTLDLDFANSKTLDPRITFTRSSGGSYVGADGLIKYAGVNEPRFDHNPVTGESLGLLIEEARTNLILNSTTLSSHWTSFYATRTLTSETTSPDGTFNAYKIIGNSGSTLRQSLNSHTFTMNANTSYTISVFLKGTASRRYATLWFDNTETGNSPVEGPYYGATSFIDLLTGTSSNPSITKMIPYGNGWYRCYVTATVGASNLTNVLLQVSIGNPNNFLDTGTPNIYKNVGDGSSGIYYWGPQLEAGAFPTSYIPTKASTVTRSADNASMTGTKFSSWYNSSEGTIFMSGIVPQGLSSFPIEFTLSDGTNSNRIGSYIFTNGFYVTIRNSNSQIGEDMRPTFTPVVSSSYKKITSYSRNEYATTVNANTITKKFNAPIPNINSLNIGSAVVGTIRYNSTISRLTYYPIQLTNQQLINLSS